MVITNVTLFLLLLLILFLKAQWSLVIEDLFLDNKPLSMFKKPTNLYDFKKKVLSAMKSRYLKVTSRGTHSGDVVSGDEDVSAGDRLAVPPPPPVLPSDLAPQMQQSAAVRNPLSVLTGVVNNNNNNNVPTLDEEMTDAIVTPKVAKHQRLTNNDCGDAISKFAEKSSGFYSTFFSYVENKAKAENRSFLLQLRDKLEKGVITQQQFKEIRHHSFKSPFYFIS